MKKLFVSILFIFASAFSFAETGYFIEFNGATTAKTFSSSKDITCAKAKDLAFDGYFAVAAKPVVISGSDFCEIKVVISTLSTYNIAIQSIVCPNGQAPKYFYTPEKPTNGLYCTPVNPDCPFTHQAIADVAIGWLPYRQDGTGATIQMWNSQKKEICTQGFNGKLCTAKGGATAFKIKHATNGAAYAAVTQVFVGELTGAECAGPETPGRAAQPSCGLAFGCCPLQEFSPLRQLLPCQPRRPHELWLPRPVS